jgi:hypothetical protein
MTDHTRPASPGETPAEGMTTEIPTQTVWDESLGDEPGIADNLGPDGGPTPTDLAPPSSDATGDTTSAGDAPTMADHDRDDVDDGDGHTGH